MRNTLFSILQDSKLEFICKGVFFTKFREVLRSLKIQLQRISVLYSDYSHDELSQNFLVAVVFTTAVFLTDIT